MTIKTRCCDECVHWAAYRWKKPQVCDKDHKPRFYSPRGQSVDWGYKRRCKDFEEKKQ